MLLRIALLAATSFSLAFQSAPPAEPPTGAPEPST
ncbi:MAG: hypothetical protein RL136_1783, partial [Planctomycetota bacterium]